MPGTMERYRLVVTAPGRRSRRIGRWALAFVGDAVVVEVLTGPLRNITGVRNAGVVAVRCGSGRDVADVLDHVAVAVFVRLALIRDQVLVTVIARLVEDIRLVGHAIGIAVGREAGEVDILLPVERRRPCQVRSAVVGDHVVVVAELVLLWIARRVVERRAGRFIV